MYHTSAWKIKKFQTENNKSLYILTFLFFISFRFALLQNKSNIIYIFLKPVKIHVKIQIIICTHNRSNRTKV